MTDWHVGTMGFGYEQWDGVFYPAGLAARHKLASYAERFAAVEMDSTFYGIPAAATIARWRAETPPSFRICPKAPREITHDTPPSEALAAVERFAQAVRPLGEKLGPILLQYPPDFTAAERPAVAALLAALPTDLRWAVEFRHRSWLGDETTAMLRARGVCWVAADYIHMPKVIWPTADFLYLRFLGQHGRYATKHAEIEDKTADLQGWLAQIGRLPAGQTSGWAFFNNDYAGYSPATANRFKRLVGQEPIELMIPRQGRLF